MIAPPPPLVTNESVAACLSSCAAMLLDVYSFVTDNTGPFTDPAVNAQLVTQAAAASRLAAALSETGGGS
ncbi:hypothetical protein J0H58_28335 [bacterium]|nr:hypothetical protein [bacterium]